MRVRSSKKSTRVQQSAQQGATTMAMSFASAYYVAQPSVEILVFIDEAPSDLPEGATLIIETKSDKELLKAVEPYFILGSS